MDFFVDKEKEQKIIKSKLRKLKGMGKILQIVNTILKILIPIPMLLAILYSVIRERFDISIFFTFFMLAFILSGVLWTITVVIDKIIWIKFMPVWTSSYNMELHLQRSGVEFGTCVAGTGDYFRTYYFDYKDITELEFDEKNHLFCITGKYVNKTWKDVNRAELVKANEKETVAKRVTFLEYFKDFDEFMSQIQLKTGLRIKYAEIKL